MSGYDRAHIGDMLADQRGKSFDWFTCRLMRLIAGADRANRAKLAKVYPVEVRAVCEYQGQYVPPAALVDQGEEIAG